jgi:phosphoribosylaminoimidazole carboxylase (NCAIR synthetase)
MPRNVVFVAPFPIETTMRFARAAAKLHDVRLLGVVHTPPEPGSPDAALFHDVVRVTEPLSTRDTIDGVEVLKRRHGKIDRVIGILEALMVQMAEARDIHGVPGTSQNTAELFRDKARMKDALRAAGLPVARHRLLGGIDDARAFANDVGFPMVLKPPAGMGAKATFRVSSEESLFRAVQGMNVRPSQPVLAEEFLRGREFSMETITVNGKPQTASFSQYLPPCLEVLENPWIKWVCLLERDLQHPVYAEAKKMGFVAIEALGLDNGMTHMEWFQRADGSLAIGEIGMRPPGANISLMTGIVHDIDPYRAWARAVVDNVLDAPWIRKRAAGCAFLRGMGQGRVARVTGVQAIQQALGNMVAEAKLPQIGATKADGYEGDGYVVVHHESTDEVRGALQKIIETVNVEYAG